MTVLHLSSHFSGTLVYHSLFCALSRFGFTQDVFSPVYSHRDEGSIPPAGSCYNLKVVPIYRHYHRVFYGRKCQLAIKQIEHDYDLNEVDLIHAHTLFSDGGVAEELNRRHGIPYLVSVRWSDLKSFLKLKPYLKPRARQILGNAKRVMCLSPAYKNRLIDMFGNEFADKIVVVPNILPQEWYDIRNKHLDEINNKSSNKHPNKVVYVGQFVKRKNIDGLVKGMNELQHQHPDNKLELRLVGGTQADLDKLGIPEPEFDLKLIERTTNKEELALQYRQADALVVPSFDETFGLAYTEGLSQGTPSVHAIDEGIDGFWPDGQCTFRCDPFSEISIADAIKRALQADVTIKDPDIEQFSSDKVSEKMFSIYQECCDRSRPLRCTTPHSEAEPKFAVAR